MERVENGSESNTFLERLLCISNENPNFTYEDVIAETTTMVTAVSLIK